MAVVALAVPAGSVAAASDVSLQSPDAQDSALDAQRGVNRPTYTPSTPVAPVSDQSSGFDWSDAGIGAAAILGLALISISVMFSVVHRRRRMAGGGQGPAVTP